MNPLPDDIRHPLEFDALLKQGRHRFLKEVTYPVLLFVPPGLYRTQNDTSITGEVVVPRRPVRLDSPPSDVRALGLVVPVQKRQAETGPEIWIGRALSCDIVLPVDGISRIHAAILYNLRDGYQIRDAGSKNGTIVNGAALESGKDYLLDDDAHLMLGDLEMAFLLPDSLYNELKRFRSFAEPQEFQFADTQTNLPQLR